MSSAWRGLVEIEDAGSKFYVFRGFFFFLFLWVVDLYREMGLIVLGLEGWYEKSDCLLKSFDMMLKNRLSGVLTWRFWVAFICGRN